MSKTKQPKYSKLNCVCDNCKKEIRIIEKEIEYLKKYKIIVNGFICPYCNTEYITAVTDNKLRADIYKARQLQHELYKINQKMEKEYKQYTDNNKKIPSSVKLKYMNLLEVKTKEFQEQVKKNKERGKQLKQWYHNNRKE